MIITKKISLMLALLVVAGIAIQSCTLSQTKPPDEPASLQIKAVQLEPAFITVGKQSKIKMAVKLSESSAIAPNNRLIIQQQRFLTNGKSSFFSIGELHNDGKAGDLSANDTIFTGTASFREAVTGVLLLRVSRSIQDNAVSSPLFSIPVYQLCGPTGTILPVNIIKGSSKKHQFKTIEFTVPSAGKATLRLVNGARIGAPYHERIILANVAVNEQKGHLISLAKNVVELPVDLVSGTNRLTVSKVFALPDQRLSVRIEACADHIALQPIAETQQVGRDVLQAVATVTTHGLPVANASVNFTLDGIGDKQQANISTSDTGVANTSFALPLPGSGTLRAKLVNSSPALEALTPVNVVLEPSLRLNQGRDEITLNSQESIRTPFFLFYLMKDGTPRHVTFEQSVKPNTGGIKLTGEIPAGGFIASNPASFTIDGAIEAVKAGSYQVTSTATIQETDEKVRVQTKVDVIDQAAPKPLFLGAPSANPSAIAPTQNAKVTFLSLVSGLTPPQTLFLDQVDADGRLLAKNLARLKDDGLGADEKAGDLAYTGTLELAASNQGERNFRVHADYFGKTTTSGLVTFGVTDFPLTPRPSDPALVVLDENNGSQIFANEVIVELLPGVSNDRLNKIAAAVNAKVVGAIPSLRTYLLEIQSPSNLEATQTAIATLQSFSEIRQTSVNEIPESFAFPADPPNDPNYPSQWYLNKIRASQAWEVVGGGDSGHAIAIIDNGVQCSHEDLNGQKGGSPLPAGECAPRSAHATELAGIIAANTNSSPAKGIAGAAYNSRFYDYNMSSNGSYTMTSAINAAASNANVRVMNISRGEGASPGLKSAVCNAISQGRLVVAAVGNVSCAPGTKPDFYPAKFNDETCAGTSNPGANLPNGLIVVGLTDVNDAASSFNTGVAVECSNPKNYVDLYAPGKNILTTEWTNAGLLNEYAAKNGTSFSTALTSGAAAVYWGYRPNSASTAVHDRLVNSALSVNLGGSYGQGKRLDLFNAVATKKVTINFKTEDASYRNLFGYYTNDPNSPASQKQAHILVENVDLATNPSLNQFSREFFLTDQGAANLQFFLIPNGADINQAYLSSVPAQNRNLVVFKDADNKWRIKDLNGTILRGTYISGQTPGGADAFFSDSALNPDGMAHVRKQNSAPVNNCASDNSTNPNDYVACWEDLSANISDRDYNDAQFSIIITNN